jgi:hypothetical protein
MSVMPQFPSKDYLRPDQDRGAARLGNQAIGMKLRVLFGNLVAEPVPDQWLSLLRQADERSTRER